MTTEQVLNRYLICQMKEIDKHLDSSFDKINNFIDQVFIIDSPISQFSNPKFQLPLLKVEQFCTYGQSEQQLSILQEMKPLLIQKIKDQVQFRLETDYNHQQLLIQSQIKHEIQCPSKFNFKPFTYQLIKENSIKQSEYCYMIAFNKDCSIVALVCKKQIKVCEFTQGKLKQIQVLNAHKNYVYTLNFMKKSNYFISGDSGGSILIWQSNENNQWNCSQAIERHYDQIRCLILNKNDDIFISSGSDNTIKFWVKKNEWICQQIITSHIYLIEQLSLNDQENKVISCGRNNYILVIEYSEQSKQWIVIQYINVASKGYRICFINNTQFTFQPYKGNFMHVYEIDSVSKQFKKTKVITINEGINICGLFPQQFIKQKQLLVNKHHQCVILIRKTESDEFKVEQSIQFGCDGLYGQMSDDGEYLITWDVQSMELQIRKYIEE